MTSSSPSREREHNGGPPAWRAIAVIPAHNEASTVSEAVALAVPHVDQVFVVDDGSSDNTADLAEGAGAKVIRLRPNRGKGTALRKGITAAIDAGADAIVTLDADGEHDPEEIPSLLAELGEADLVLGARNEFRSPSRALANSFALWWFRQIDPSIDDTICGFRAFRAAVVRVIDSQATGFAYEHEVVLRAVAAQLRSRESGRRPWLHT